MTLFGMYATCSNSNQCNNNYGLSCVSGRCSCNLTSYSNNLYCGIYIFFFFFNFWLIKKNHLKRFYLCSILESYRTVNQYCDSLALCMPDVGLSCSSNTCRCSIASTFWNGTACCMNNFFFILKWKICLIRKISKKKLPYKLMVLFAQRLVSVTLVEDCRVHQNFIVIALQQLYGIERHKCAVSNKI
jgi:hypothetical protein